MIDGERNARQRADMEHALDAIECGPDGFEVREVEFVEIRACRDVIALSGREVVYYAHAVAFLQERIREVAPDEPGSAGDEVERHIV